MLLKIPKKIKLSLIVINYERYFCILLHMTHKLDMMLDKVEKRIYKMLFKY